MYYGLNITDIVLAYLSPWLAHEKRKIFQDQAPWRRKEEYVFMYGYNYAQMLSIFAITIFLSSTVPLISVAALFYCICRHVTDAVNLLTVYRKEIDSSGRLIETATNAALWFVMIFQVFMMAFFVLTDQLNEAMVCVVIFVVSSLYIVASYEKVHGLLIHDEEAPVTSVMVNRGSIRIMDTKKRD
jgi:hypothetical protein